MSTSLLRAYHHFILVLYFIASNRREKAMPLRRLAKIICLLALPTLSNTFMLFAARPVTATSRFLCTAMPATATTSNALQDVAKRLIHNNNKQEKQAYVCIGVAGGGGHAISTLASTPGASSLFLEGTVTYDRNSLQAYIKHQILPDDFKYVSQQAAQLLSRAALRHALQYRSNIDDYGSCIGVGISTALITNKFRKKGSFGYVCATLGDGSSYSAHIKLAPNARTRTEEDQLMGQLALQAIEQLQSSAAPKIAMELSDDLIEETMIPVDTQHDTVIRAAESILKGDASAVLLLPSSDDNKKQFIAVTDPVLPMESLVFPGSFNPPHEGHTTLAQAASRAWKGSSQAVFMELSLTNPDKPSMSPESVSERAHHFFELPQEALPPQWGVLLTSAPLFQQKVQALTPYMATYILRPTSPQLGFVIGTDTMVRILNPKYYNDSKEDMLESVREMGRSGVHFVVGGRLEQGGGIPKFVTGQAELAELPRDVQKIFTLVCEEDFREDISSTEIRKRAESKEEEVLLPVLEHAK